MVRRRLRAILAAASLLVLGGVLGITLERVLFTTPVETASEPVDAQAEVVAFLRAELDLAPSRVADIEAILARRQAEVTRAWETITAAMDTARSEIEAVLTPEQRDRFRLWLANQHAAAGRSAGDVQGHR